MNQESDVKICEVEQAKRGENSGPGSLWFVIQSVSLCPGPQGFNDDPLVCFFWNSPMWIWSFVSPQREFLAADVRIILHEFGGWSTSIIVWWGKSASATFRFLPMFMLQNMNISNNSNILQLECVKSRLWTILLRLPFNLGYFVAIWFRAFSHCSKWTGATWQRWHHDKEPAWDYRCLKVWLVKHQSSTKGSQAILGPFCSLFHKKRLFVQNFTKGLGVLGCVRLTIHNISDGCRRCHIRELCSDFYEDAGTPRDTCSSVTRSLGSWNIFKRNVRMLLEAQWNLIKKSFSVVVRPLNSQAEKPEGWQMFVWMSRCTRCIGSCKLDLPRKLQQNWRTSSTKGSRVGVVLSRLQRRPQVKLCAMKFSSLTGYQHFND